MNRAWKLPAAPPHSDSWIGNATRLAKWTIDDSLDREFGLTPKGKPASTRIPPHTINKTQRRWKTLCEQHFGPSHLPVKKTKLNDDEYTLSGENF